MKLGLVMICLLQLMQRSPTAWEPPPTKPLDEGVWQAWVAKGRAQDKRSRVVTARAVKWVPIAGTACRSGTVVPPGVIRRSGQIHRECGRDRRGLPRLPYTELWLRGRIWSARAPLQPGAPGVRFYGHLAARRRRAQRGSFRRITGVARRQDETTCLSFEGSRRDGFWDRSSC